MNRNQPKNTKIKLPAEHFGKKRYLLNMELSGVKHKARKVPDYRMEEFKECDKSPELKAHLLKSTI